MRLKGSFLFAYLFLAVLGLHCCTWAFSSCGEWGLLSVAVCGLLTVVASRGARAQASVCSTQSGSVVVAHGLSSSSACGIFLDQGSDPCSLHWRWLSCSSAYGIFLDQGSNPCSLHWRWTPIHCTTRGMLKESLVIRMLLLMLFMTRSAEHRNYSALSAKGSRAVLSNKNMRIITYSKILIAAF